MNKQFQSLRTEIGQFSTRESTETQQIVREQMYYEFKKNNILVTKRLEEIKAFVKRQVVNAQAGNPDPGLHEGVVTTTDFEQFRE